MNDFARALGAKRAAAAGTDYIPGRGGEPVSCAENVYVGLNSNPAFDGMFAFDEFSSRVLAWKSDPEEAELLDRPAELSETLLNKMIRWFNREGLVGVGKSMVRDTIDEVARSNPCHVVRDYLCSLEWDGKPRADRFLVDYCGVPDSHYARAVSQSVLLSAVARVERPGCKVDTVLILEGLQGTGKSSLVRHLAVQPEWFSDSIRDFGSKDTSLALRGKWIVELSELAAMGRSQAEEMKAFITRTEERYRPPYASQDVCEPRQCIFIGTTNSANYLSDQTGNRRFLPIRVGAIDLEAIEADRDQIWAEAVERYGEDERWWISGEIEGDARKAQEARQHEDPWTGHVEQICSRRSEVSVTEIMDAIGLEASRMGRAESNRVTSILACMGWVRDGRFSKGSERGRARFVPRDGPAGDLIDG